MITLTVDEKEIHAEDGTSLLKACLDNDIYIPNLCCLDEMTHPPASCRMCFVEIDGMERPQTSCTVVVKEGMVVRTDTDAVRMLQRTALRLLLSMHRVDCAHCPANKKCEIQKIAKFLKIGLKPKGLESIEEGKETDRTHPLFDLHPYRCVLCGRCVFVCRSLHKKPLITFSKRGIDTVITCYAEDDTSTHTCRNCLACVDVCPVAAITLKDEDAEPKQS